MSVVFSRRDAEWLVKPKDCMLAMICASCAASCSRREDVRKFIRRETKRGEVNLRRLDARQRIAQQRLVPGGVLCDAITAGQLRWGVWSPGSYTFVYGNVTNNQWRYAVVSFNNGATLHSMNGLVVGNVTAVSQPFDGYWRIGGQSLNFWPSAAAGFFVGSIASVEIYNRPLVITEIEQNFNINRGRFGL